MTHAKKTAYSSTPDPDLDEKVDSGFRDRLGDRLEAFLPETVKKLALAGMGAIFMTEEGIRNAVSDMKLPREAVSSLLSQTEKARSELFRLIALELRRFLEDANLAGELRKVLIGLSLDINASISFRQSEDGRIDPDVKLKKGQSPGDDGADRIKKKTSKSGARKASIEN